MIAISLLTLVNLLCLGYSVRDGPPEGTVSGPDDLKLLINDLQFNISYAVYVVDDRT